MKRNSPNRFTSCTPSLRSVAIGAASVSAGMSLPLKAEATIIANSTLTTAPGDNAFINIRFNPTGTQSTIAVNSSGGIGLPGWNIGLETAFLPSASSELAAIFQGGSGFSPLYQYQFLASSYTLFYDFGSLGGTQIISIYNVVTFSQAQSFDLANYPSSFAWVTSGGGYLPSPAPNDPFYIGLRYVDPPSLSSFYGWAHLQYGSVSHLQSAFNSQNGGPITIGQIPEPSAAALLLAAGSTGLLTARRRRQKNTSTACPS